MRGIYFPETKEILCDGVYHPIHAGLHKMRLPEYCLVNFDLDKGLARNIKLSEDLQKSASHSLTERTQQYSRDAVSLPPIEILRENFYQFLDDNGLGVDQKIEMIDSLLKYKEKPLNQHEKERLCHKRAQIVMKATPLSNTDSLVHTEPKRESALDDLTGFNTDKLSDFTIKANPEFCPRCGGEYISKAGICRCGADTAQYGTENHVKKNWRSMIASNYSPAQKRKIALFIKTSSTDPREQSEAIYLLRKNAWR